jgi:hypothetical protein
LLLAKIWEILGNGKPMWANRHKIVGFTRIAYLPAHVTVNQIPRRPLGARVLNPGVSGKPEDYLHDNKNMPWATETHRCAKIYGLGSNGPEVLKWPEGRYRENPPSQSKPPDSPNPQSEIKGLYRDKKGRMRRLPPGVR